MVKKEWIAKDIIHLNYDSVIEMNKISDGGENNGSSIAYRDLTDRESKAYSNALHRIRNEESITKGKGR